MNKVMNTYVYLYIRKLIQAQLQMPFYPSAQESELIDELTTQVYASPYTYQSLEEQIKSVIKNEQTYIQKVLMNSSGKRC